MGYAVYRIGEGRHGGYGVPAYCEHPECNEEIDRGMSFACGGEPFSEIGCDKYFCSKHRHYTGFKQDGSALPECLCDCEDDPENEKECECEWKEVCASCAGLDKEYPYGYPYKPEHPEWVYHVLNHYTWEEYRKENPDIVAKLLLLPSRMPEGWTNDPDEDK